jgi:predicted NUDIX family NTP pyrophosphohydrolase
MSKKSAGLLLFRYSENGLEVLLVHPGGPLWASRDEGAWSIPKGEFSDDEDPLGAARREFEEETGVVATGDPIPLEPVRQPSGKILYAWALEGEVDVTRLKSNTFSMEWPPGSGRQREFPEVDRGEWLSIEAAERKMLRGQLPLLRQLVERLGTPSGPSPR